MIGWGCFFLFKRWGLMSARCLNSVLPSLSLSLSLSEQSCQVGIWTDYLQRFSWKFDEMLCLHDLCLLMITCWCCCLTNCNSNSPVLIISITCLSPAGVLNRAPLFSCLVFRGNFLPEIYRVSLWWKSYLSCKVVLVYLCSWRCPFVALLAPVSFNTWWCVTW